MKVIDILLLVWYITVRIIVDVNLEDTGVVQVEYTEKRLRCKSSDLFNFYFSESYIFRRFLYERFNFYFF